MTVEFNVNGEEQKILYKIHEILMKNDYNTMVLEIGFNSFFKEFKNMNGMLITEMEFKNLIYGLRYNSIRITKDDGKTIYVPWVNNIRKFGNNIILSIDEYVINFFKENNKKFKKLNLENLYSLTSIYSMRIYELLKQYNRKDISINVEKLKKELNIEDNKEYNIFSNFEKILERAIEEINIKTELNVEYRAIKFGRKVEEIRLTIIKKGEPEKDPMEEVLLRYPSLKREDIEYILNKLVNNS